MTKLEKLNRESEQLWASKYEHISAKVGTVPTTIWIDRPTAEGLMNRSLSTGDRIKWCDGEWGQTQSGIIEEVRFTQDDTLSILFVSRF